MLTLGEPAFGEADAGRGSLSSCGMRVLFVSAHPPLPADSGGRQRTFHLLEQLAEGAAVSLVCFDRDPGASAVRAVRAERIAAELPRLEDVVTVAPPQRSKRATQLSVLVSGRSYTLALYRSTALRKATRAAANAIRPHILHCDGLFCAFVRDEAPNAQTVLALHNHESLLKRRLSETADSTTRRLLYRAEARAVARLERSTLPTFDHCLAVSETEARTLRALNRSTEVVPNGVPPLPPPAPPAPLAADEPLRLLFVGSLNYEPNHRGLAWFASEVLPLVRARVPVQVDAVGAGRRGASAPGIEFRGRVDDLAPLYRRASAAIVPLLAGGGSRLKVLEALAMGTPLVSTRLGAEGFDLAAGRHALLADDPSAFAGEILRLEADLRSEARLAASLQAEGYRYATEFFWPRIGDRLRTLYAGSVAR
jgi:glycosyltransferase involved in cell wall biosynthesis